MAGEMARLWDNSDPAGSVPAAGLWLSVRIEEAGRPKGEALSAGAPVEGSGGGRQRLHTEGSWCGVGRPGCARTRVCLSFLSVLPVFRKSLELNAEDGAGHSSEILNKAVGMGCIGCAT